MKQLFIAAGEGFRDDQDAFERKLYVIRRIVELAAGPDFYSPSFSSRTIVYKGMLISHQLRGFYPDLQTSASPRAWRWCTRASRRTRSPAGSSATPTAWIAHNGEINTLMGNVNWMRAASPSWRPSSFGLDLQKVMPIVRPAARTRRRSTTSSSC